jgi:hypothetical protein
MSPSFSVGRFPATRLGYSSNVGRSRDRSADPRRHRGTSRVSRRGMAEASRDGTDADPTEEMNEEMNDELVEA